MKKSPKLIENKFNKMKPAPKKKLGKKTLPKAKSNAKGRSMKPTPKKR